MKLVSEIAARPVARSTRHSSLLLLVLAASFLQGCTTDATSSARPNVLLIIADDLGWGDIGALGSEIPTPHIDSLAADGVMLTNFHTASTCSPSRSMLLTGVDSHLAGLGNMITFMPPNQRGKPGYEGHLNRRVRTLGELFQAGGYTTGFFGKWHLGEEPGQLPHDRGFEHTLALVTGGSDTWSARGAAPVRPPVEPFSRNGKLIERPDGFAALLYTDELLDFLTGPAAEKPSPFLAVLSFQSVHWPHHAPDDALARHANRYDVGWDEIRGARHERLIEKGLLPAGTPMRERDPRVPAWDELDAATRRTEARRMAAYAAMLDHMDQQIGRVLDELDRSGRSRNTIVVFVSDNGPDQSEPNRAPRAIPWYAKRYPKTSDEELGRPGSFPTYGPQWAQSGAVHLRGYKGMASEGGMLVPLIVRYPDEIAAGKQTGAFAFAPDLVPTLLDAAGLSHPAEGLVQNGDAALHPPTGRSAWPALRGAVDRIHPKNEAIGYDLMMTAALFQGDYKLVRNGPPIGNGEWMLFDLAQDPGEREDLSGRMPELRANMMQAFDAYSERVGVVPVPEDYDVFEMLIGAPRSQ
ncbi:MAG: sulfatase-like hydrolase/transferase [Deltaproteobacteria bacterium]|nr:sulfatase-like hydrolase/transferase [Deltaproteobacteria bacterium]